MDKLEHSELLTLLKRNDSMKSKDVDSAARVDAIKLEFDFMTQMFTKKELGIINSDERLSELIEAVYENAFTYGVMHTFNVKERLQEELTAMSVMSHVTHGNA